MGLTIMCRGHKETKDSKAPQKLKPGLSLKHEKRFAAVAEETVVPNVEAPVESSLSLMEPDPSTEHIYFKDLKLLAHDNSDESADNEQGLSGVQQNHVLDHQTSFASDASSPHGDMTSPSVQVIHYIKFGVQVAFLFVRGYLKPS